MIVDAFDVKATDAKIEFADVEAGAWYEQYVNVAAQNKIVSGIGNGVFGVGDNITRQDAAVILNNAVKMIVENGKLDFTDSDEISAYAKEAVKQLSTIGVINGIGDGSFAPKANCTRAQAAVMIYRLLGYINK